jgi:hypothetical protein
MRHGNWKREVKEERKWKVSELQVDVQKENSEVTEKCKVDKVVDVRSMYLERWGHTDKIGAEIWELRIRKVNRKWK